MPSVTGSVLSLVLPELDAYAKGLAAMCSDSKYSCIQVTDRVIDLGLCFHLSHALSCC